MKTTIQQKEFFTIGGLEVVMNEETDYPKIWEELNRKVSSQQIKAMGSGEAFGAFYGKSEPDQFYYMASFDVKHVDIAIRLGLTLLEVPPAEYAVVSLKGSIPNNIRNGWAFVMEKYFPEHGYTHANTPSFEVYLPGDMTSDDYEMEFWVPIAPEESGRS